MSTLVGSEIEVLQAAFEDAPFAFWVRDADDRCIVQNAISRSRWGDVRGHRTDDAPTAPEVRAAWQAKHAAARTGQLVQVEAEVPVAGEPRYFHYVIAPLVRGGEAAATLGFTVDVTDRVIAEKALRESERKLRKALDVGRIGHIEWDLATNRLAWSPEMCRIFGFPPDHAPTLDGTLNLVPTEDRARVDAAVQGVLSAGTPLDLIHRMRRADGTVIHVHVQGETLRARDGQPLRLLGTVVDVTERAQAEEALRVTEERLNHALLAASAGIWEWDVRTRVVTSSAQNRALYGFDPDGPEPASMEWNARIHDEDRERASAHMAAAADGRVASYRDEFRVMHPTRGVRWLLVVGQLQRGESGEPELVRGITLDITDRKRAEEELHEVDRRRTEFLGVLSHELRNPLTPIRNSLHILEQSRAGSEAATRALSTMKRQVTHLSRLVDDLLDATRIASGKVRLQREPLDLVALVRRTIDDHRALLAGRPLSVRLPDAAWVNGDATRLSQVLGNLLQNAAKFTNEGQAVTVTLTRKAGRALIEVSDEGIGIDAETLKGLFVPFTQADRSLDRSRGGLGLGLALVKSLVELHGGTIEATSAGRGRGSEFTLRLPCEEAAAAVAAPEAVASAKSPRRVLIIEDNVDVAHSLADVLELSGHQTEVAFSGASGMAKARALRPDIVLCDIGLPDVDGYAVAQELRQDVKLKHAYCVALTGYARPEDQKKAREAGFDAHLAKPPDPDVLQQLLARAPVRRQAL